MDRGAWRATVYGGGRVGHNLVTKKQNNMKIWAANSKVEIWVCDELVLSLNIGLEKEISYWCVFRLIDSSSEIHLPGNSFVSLRTNLLSIRIQVTSTHFWASLVAQMVKNSPAM